VTEVRKRRGRQDGSAFPMTGREKENLHEGGFFFSSAGNRNYTEFTTLYRIFEMALNFHE
jgi:hypothetical protein